MKNEKDFSSLKPEKGLRQKKEGESFEKMLSKDLKRLVNTEFKGFKKELIKMYGNSGTIDFTIEELIAMFKEFNIYLAEELALMTDIIATYVKQNYVKRRKCVSLPSQKKGYEVRKDGKD